MAGADPERVVRLPDTSGMKNRVVIQAGHLVNYGQPVDQAVRLSGAEVVVAGDDESCSREALETALDDAETVALLIVDSRLCKGAMVAPADAVSLARARAIPAIIDAAAQDLRMADVLSYGADLTIFSAQKYLAAPTVGLVLGKETPVTAFRAQETGIGRGMKASKEAIIGLLAAVRERGDEDLDAWRESKAAEAEAFAADLDGLNGIAAKTVPDPTEGPFRRVEAEIASAPSGRTAAEIAAELGKGDPAGSASNSWPYRPTSGHSCSSESGNWWRSSPRSSLYQQVDPHRLVEGITLVAGPAEAMEGLAEGIVLAVEETLPAGIDAHHFLAVRFIVGITVSIDIPEFPAHRQFSAVGAPDGGQCQIAHYRFVIDRRRQLLERPFGHWLEDGDGTASTDHPRRLGDRRVHMVPRDVV